MLTVGRMLVVLVTTTLYVTVDLPIAIFTKGNI